MIAAEWDIEHIMVYGLWRHNRASYATTLT